MPTTRFFRLAPARQEAILAAAEAEFGARGFSQGSLNVIARTAGVSKGSLFQYFTDKADLCGYLSELVCSRVRAEVTDHFASLPTQDFRKDGSGNPRRASRIATRDGGGEKRANSVSFVTFLCHNHFATTTLRHCHRATTMREKIVRQSARLLDTPIT